MAKRTYSRTPQQPKVVRQLKPPFLAFTSKFAGRVSQLITPIKITTAFDLNTTSPDQIKQYETTAYDTKALWDTGATNSVVTEATAAAMGLVPIGSAVVNHAGGSSTKNRYLINVYLPNNVAIVGVMASDMPEGSGGFGILIGMDIISQGDLSISNQNNTTWLSFRFPSYKTTDYVVESDRITFAGVPRSKPCPCGSIDSSGKPILFKYCHGKNL